MNMQELRERRNAAAKEARNFYENNKGRKWTDEDNKKFDALTAAVTDADDEIKRLQKVLDLDADNAFRDAGGREREENAGGDPANKSRDIKVKALFQKYLRNGRDSFTSDDLALIQNTMSVGTGSQGGYTVQTEIAKTLSDAMKSYIGMRQVAEIFQTAQGNQISYPTSDGTSEIGEIVAENAAAAAADPTFGTIPLTTYKFSSKIITVPFELLQDSSIDVEAMITKRIRDRLGRITNRKFTIGTGTSEPQGVMPAVGVGKTGLTGQTTTVIYDDIIDLEHSVDPAYRALGNCRFMLHDNSIKVVRKLKDSQNRPLWLPSFDAGVRGGVPQELAGYPITINQDVATMAANAVSIAFGDFSNYKIRDVMELTMFRFTDSVYASKGQVGFLAWMRSGGAWVDVGGAVKTYQNSAT